jgi:hypothetical protein
MYEAIQLPLHGQKQRLQFLEPWIGCPLVYDFGSSRIAPAKVSSCQRRVGREKIVGDHEVRIREGSEKGP